MTKREKAAKERIVDGIILRKIRQVISPGFDDVSYFAAQTGEKEERIIRILRASDDFRNIDKDGLVWELTRRGVSSMMSELSKPISVSDSKSEKNRFPNRFPIREPIGTYLTYLECPHMVIIAAEIMQKRHIGDKKHLALLWIHHIGGLLPSKYRMGGKITGPTVAGKDHGITTVQENVPMCLYKSTTQTSDKYYMRTLDTLKPNIYFKEMNMKQKGANINNIELLKALLEDGFEYGFLEKDDTGRWLPVDKTTSRHNCFYSTTELGGDDELLNRVLQYHFRGGVPQTRGVIRLIAEESKSLSRLEETDKPTPFLREAVECLESLDGVILPFFPGITEFVNTRKETARRYFRHLKNATSWMAFLHQKQRKIVVAGRRRYVEAQPIDLIMALVLMQEGLQRSYSGDDPRIEEAMKTIGGVLPGGGYVPMSAIKKKMGLNKKVAWQLFDELQNLNLIEVRASPADKRCKEIKPLSATPETFLSCTIEDIFKKIGSDKTTRAIYNDFNAYFNGIGTLSKPIETYLKPFFPDYKPIPTETKNDDKNEIGSLKNKGVKEEYPLTTKSLCEIILSELPDGKAGKISDLQRKLCKARTAEGEIDTWAFDETLDKMLKEGMLFSPRPGEVQRP